MKDPLFLAAIALDVIGVMLWLTGVISPLLALVFFIMALGICFNELLQ